MWSLRRGVHTRICPFDREAPLDLIVNAVPLAMLAGFLLLFAVLSPYGIDPVPTAIQFTLVLVPFGALEVLSYYAAKTIQRADATLGAGPESFAGPQAVAASPDADVEYNEPVGGSDDSTGGETDTGV